MAIPLAFRSHGGCNAWMLSRLTPSAFPLFLAPMAGVSDTVFRQICKRFGADVMVTEFVSAEGIFHRNRRTSAYLEFAPMERPLGVQLFGADPEHLALAARQVVDWVGPDFIDLNFGCPVNKVVCKNGGSALLRDAPLLVAVAAAVVHACAPLPVTAKIRTGWDASSINAVDNARRLEDAGIAAIAVHGRTKSQGYSGEADWDVIAAVAGAVTIPVIGNGDLRCAEDVVKRRNETGIAAAMIGRAAMGHPWIFSEIKTYWRTGVVPPPPTDAVRWELIREHCAAVVTRRGNEATAMASMRARLMAYSRGMNGSRHLREQFSSVDSLAGLEEIAARHLAAD